MVLATLWTTAGRLAEAQLPPLPLTVAIYDYAALPPPVLERSKGVATEIYGRIGVSLVWLDGPQVAAALPTNTAACPDSPTPVIRLRLLPRSANPRRPAGDLGSAVSGGWLALVLVERVEYVATSKGLDVEDLLGVVMAHEIGHLLLPPDSHSAAGIMAEKVDLFLIEHGGPSFDHRQASMIRARITSMACGDIVFITGRVHDPHASFTDLPFDLAATDTVGPPAALGRTDELIVARANAAAVRGASPARARAARA
jgi:hypothetical protein